MVSIIPFEQPAYQRGLFRNFDNAVTGQPRFSWQLGDLLRAIALKERSHLRN
jgi:hypothetical protein